MRAADRFFTACASSCMKHIHVMHLLAARHGQEMHWSSKVMFRYPLHTDPFPRQKTTRCLASPKVHWHTLCVMPEAHNCTAYATWKLRIAVLSISIMQAAPESYLSVKQGEPVHQQCCAPRPYATSATSAGIDDPASAQRNHAQTACSTSTTR